MGTALRYVGDFSAERTKLGDINKSVTDELASMTSTLEGMSAYWQDDKSEEFLSAAKEYIADIQKKMAKAFEAGNLTLTEIEKALEIYQ